MAFRSFNRSLNSVASRRGRPLFDFSTALGTNALPRQAVQCFLQLETDWRPVPDYFNMLLSQSGTGAAGKGTMAPGADPRLLILVWGTWVWQSQQAFFSPFSTC